MDLGRKGVSLHIPEGRFAVNLAENKYDSFCIESMKKITGGA